MGLDPGYLVSLTFLAICGILSLIATFLCVCFPKSRIGKRIQRFVAWLLEEVRV